MISAMFTDPSPEDTYMIFVSRSYFPSVPFSLEKYMHKTIFQMPLCEPDHIPHLSFQWLKSPLMGFMFSPLYRMNHGISLRQNIKKMMPSSQKWKAIYCWVCNLDEPIHMIQGERSIVLLPSNYINVSWGWVRNTIPSSLPVLHLCHIQFANRRSSILFAPIQLQDYAICKRPWRRCF